MKFFLQNKVAGSKLTLPFAIAYTLCVWLWCGMLQRHLWIQFACFVVSSFLMMVLNNQNALTRIFSRMVSSVFLVLSCSACFLMADIRGNIMQLLVIAAYLMLFQSYQDKTASGLTFYAFLLLSSATLVLPHSVVIIPMIWVLMATNLLSLSWRTWFASVLGLLTPYWFWVCWLIYQQDLTPVTAHFMPLTDSIFCPISYLSHFDIPVLLVLALLVVCTVTGIIHYIRKSYMDSIRVRLLYGFMIAIDTYAFVLLAVMPQHYDMLMRIIIINTAPLIAHFLALTSTKVTNIAFHVLTAIVLLITAYNIWITSSLF